ncbi:hypothetical protein BGX28_010246 [Mortierella sp. GBA30]|nr:hypothetical protein BGX28_010246 [Mortierella sp. GBA30]
MSLAVTSIAVSTRMVDLYYIQPWTRIPSRYVIRQASIVPTDAIARSKKDIDLKDDKDTDQDCVTKDHTDTTQITFDEFLNWDMDRFKLEMWSPLRNFSIKPKASHHDAVSPSLRWQDLVLRATLYSVILDIDLYLTSHYTAAQVEAMSTLQYGLFTFGIGAFIILYILWVVLSIAMVYSYSTGRRIDTAEWTMITNKVPCFALTPAEFWISWQTLFRYLWVDLGFLPVERACKRYLTEDRVGVRLARMAREALPVLAVFALSGILHGYVVYAVWGESIWSQIAYFMIQGLGVVVTKALERTVLGTQIRQTYHASGSLVRLCMQVVGILMMGLYHTATLPLFLYPYQKHAMWLEMKERSILWWLFGSL